MNEYRKLCDLRPGETAAVLRLPDSAHALAVRLADLGLTAGSRVTCTMTSPLGDPSAYLIRGAVIALRRSDAASVTVAAAEDVR